MELECCELTHNYDYENAGEYSPGCIDCGRCDCFGDGFRIEKCTVVAKITSTVCEKCVDTKEHIKKYLEKSIELDTHQYLIVFNDKDNQDNVCISCEKASVPQFAEHQDFSSVPLYKNSKNIHNFQFYYLTGTP